MAASREPELHPVKGIFFFQEAAREITAATRPSPV